MSRAIVIFARAPEVEAAAKRLPMSAAALFRDITAQWLRAAASAGATPVIACEPGAHVRFEAIAPEVPRLYIEQRGATFGVRLASAADDAFALGFAELLLTGIDVPLTVPVASVFEALTRAEAVVQPARDGGINVIAFRCGRGRPRQRAGERARPHDLRAAARELLSSIEPRQRDLVARCRAQFDSLIVLEAAVDIDSLPIDRLPFTEVPVHVDLPRPHRRHTARPPPCAG